MSCYFIFRHSVGARVTSQVKPIFPEQRERRDLAANGILLTSFSNFQMMIDHGKRGGGRDHLSPVGKTHIDVQVNH